ncbi:molybdate ABC transporter permease [Candidatus Methylomirabilis lanthanidiphila]|uniref:Molybdenum transport system permease n=1 Tax=Candidatus Methylomirabilis lanthanidiphila TaxID=2211376 RepID=A0A564ZLX3_9BACT|nr:molybdate ABC transporter permease subunit [Candidatus Methylomirabilis lanthanidiphila]VUZ86311.1 molybdate ABC transporter permease [Candidatus Methylomirabilis lanthanidiphila]
MAQISLAPLLLSLKIASLATVAALLLGTPVAWLLARGRFPGRAVLESIVVVPLILPPTVIGYYLLLLVGRQGPLGRILEEGLNIGLIFTWKAAVLASTIAALPLFIKAAQGAFEGIDRRIEDAGLTFKPLLIVLCTITLPLAWRGMLAGAILAFARAMGEFGITLMIAGNIPGRTQTLALAIYDAVQANQPQEANAMSILATAAVLLILVLVARMTKVRY